MMLFRLAIGFCAELSGANMAQTEVLAVIAVGARWKLRNLIDQYAMAVAPRPLDCDWRL